MKTTFQEVLSKYSPEHVAEEIVKAAADTSLQPDSLIAEFDVSAGVMKGKGRPNTWIRFDSSGGPIRHVVDAMKSAEDVTDEDIVIFDEWRDEISNNLISNYRDEISNIVRDRILKGAPTEAIPMDQIYFLDIDISDLPENDCVLVIKKNTPHGESPTPVSEDIFSEMAKTGESPQQVVDRRKKEGDERYRWVSGVEARKHFFEATVSISIDYSFSSVEENSI